MHKKILCDLCKEKIATVHYTEIVNNKLKKMDLCEDCAKQKNIGINVQFSVADILKGLTEPQAEKKEEPSKTCPLCGLTFSAFRKTGKLGCGECYEAFSEELIPIIGDIHKNTLHVGGRPAVARGVKSLTSKMRDQINTLSGELETAIKNENYEQAAILRDKIKALQGKIDNKKKD
jgi:protein arginine kinase activator